LASDWERGFAAGWNAARLGVEDLLSGEIEGTQFEKPMHVKAPVKRKRKASAYSKRYGAAYKSLKAKHPRMSFGALSKKAHKQARRK